PPRAFEPRAGRPREDPNGLLPRRRSKGWTSLPGSEAVTAKIPGDLFADSLTPRCRREAHECNSALKAGTRQTAHSDARITWFVNWLFTTCCVETRFHRFLSRA